MGALGLHGQLEEDPWGSFFGYSSAGQCMTAPTQVLAPQDRGLGALPG